MYFHYRRSTRTTISRKTKSMNRFSTAWLELTKLTFTASGLAFLLLITSGCNVDLRDTSNDFLVILDLTPERIQSTNYDVGNDIELVENIFQLFRIKKKSLLESNIYNGFRIKVLGCDDISKSFEKQLTYNDEGKPNAAKELEFQESLGSVLCSLYNESVNHNHGSCKSKVASQLSFFEFDLHTYLTRTSTEVIGVNQLFVLTDRIRLNSDMGSVELDSNHFVLKNVVLLELLRDEKFSASESQMKNHFGKRYTGKFVVTPLPKSTNNVSTISNLKQVLLDPLENSTKDFIQLDTNCVVRNSPTLRNADTTQFYCCQTCNENMKFLINEFTCKGKTDSYRFFLDQNKQGFPDARLLEDDRYMFINIYRDTNIDSVMIYRNENLKFLPNCWIGKCINGKVHKFENNKWQLLSKRPCKYLNSDCVSVN